MKKSIKTQITLIFGIILILIIAMCILVNTMFLRRYYQGNKMVVLKGAYEKIDFLFSQSDVDFGTEASNIEFEKICTRDNLSVIVVNSDLEPIKTSDGSVRGIYERLLSYILKDDTNYLFKDEDTPRIKDVPLENSDSYTIRLTTDLRMGTEYIELMGALSDDYYIMIRTPMESIEESAGLSNKFLLYIGIFAMLIGCILVRLATGSVTRPILNLVELSERMTNLDFEAKYTGSEENEVGYLGQHMNKMSETLERTITELKNANAELKRDLENRERLDEMRSEFISNVSHELKTPIALIQGYAEGLMDEVNEDQESREYYCEVIIDEASRMNRMVKNLLTLNQLEYGGEKVNLERIDIVLLINNYIKASKVLIEQAGACVNIVGEKSLYVWGDEYKIEELIANYFTNAIHHVGGEKRIDISIVKNKDKCRVSVFNTGEVIPEEAISQIWTKFYKVDKARSRSYGGSGIGLSIVKAIMDQAGQEYGVINHENGVEFWFELDCK